MPSKIQRFKAAALPRRAAKPPATPEELRRAQRGERLRDREAARERFGSGAATHGAAGLGGGHPEGHRRSH